MSTFNFSTYLSPFTWRYGSPEMRQIFSEENKFRLWRKIWVALARAQMNGGLISQKEFDDIVKNEKNIDIEQILEIEKETKHDVVAAIKEYAAKAKVGGGKIHLGATSMDIVDNADMLRQIQALDLVQKKVCDTLKAFLPLIQKYADFPCIAYTHLQPAEPTTLGYRFAYYAQDLLTDTSIIQIIKVDYLQGKGLKGAVGTAASYERLLHGKKISAEKLEQLVVQELKLKAALITNQTYPRKFDYLLLSSLASIAQSLYKFALDLRFLQSPQIGELSEPFGKKQVGSSAMPFKRNPINSEKICSLARYIATLPRIFWDNAAFSHLERTLDDSANKRIAMAEAFLAIDEILLTAQKIITGLVINEKRIEKNLALFAPFAAIEIILLEAVKKGGDRQKLHEVLRELSLSAWEDIEDGKENPLVGDMKKNSTIGKYLSSPEIDTLINVKTHIGIAPKKSRDIAKLINKIKF